MIIFFLSAVKDRMVSAGTAALIVGLTAATVAVVVVFFIVFIVRQKRTRGRYMRRLQKSGRGGGF